MIHRSSRRLLVLLAVLVALVVPAGSAFAASADMGWTVTGQSADGSYTAGPGSMVVVDVTTHQSFTCTMIFSINAPNRSSGSGEGLLAITDVMSQSCSGPLGSVFTVTRPSGSAWHFNAEYYDPVTDVVHGSITNVVMELTGSTLLGLCDGTITGALNSVTYDNTDDTLRIYPDSSGLTLHITDGSGCAGLLNEGDPVTVSAVLPVTPPMTIQPSGSLS